MKPYYPLMIDLTEKPCCVIGGGQVAERKVKTLLKSNANITVISLNATTDIIDLAASGRIILKTKEYLKGDLEGFFLIIIATDNKDVNLNIYQEVNHSTQFVNIVDAPELCTFIVPSSINRGNLQIAISTNGASPGLAKKIRRELEGQYGFEYEEYTQFLSEMREWVFNHEIDAYERSQFFQRLLDEDIFERIKSGEKELLIKELKLDLQQVKK